MDTQQIVPKQGNYLFVFVVKCDEYTEAVFTNKVQAEAYIRLSVQEDKRGYHRYRLYEYETQPHDNNC